MYVPGRESRREIAAQRKKTRNKSETERNTKQGKMRVITTERGRYKESRQRFQREHENRVVARVLIRHVRAGKNEDSRASE